MVKFGTLRVEGFCSILSEEFDLNTPQVNVLRAPNGTGKTTILNALLWCLYGKTSKGVKSVNTYDWLVGKDYLGTMVSVTFEKDGKIHKIIRCKEYKAIPETLNVKGKNNVFLQIDGELEKEKYKGQINQKIEQCIGMSFEVFSHSIMVGQGMKRFSQLGSADKNKIFEQIFNIEYINIAREIANTNKKSLQIDLNLLEEKLESFTSEVENLKDISKARELEEKEFKKNREIEVSELKKKIKNVVIDLDKDKLYKKRSKYLENLRTIDNEIVSLNTQYRSNKEIIDKLTQPNSLKEFLNSLVVLIENKKSKKAISEISKVLGTIDLAFENYNNKQEKHLQRLEVAKRVEEISSSLNSILSKENILKDLNERLETTRNRKLSDFSARKVKLKIEDLESKISKLSSSIDPLTEDLGVYKYLTDVVLSNKGIKSYLIDSSLVELNLLLSELSTIIGYRVEVGVNLDNKSKDYYILIEKDGNVVEYEELSGGQKQLVYVVLSIGLHHLVSINSGINSIFFDEVFESLDDENIEIVLNLISSLTEGKSVFIASHIKGIVLKNSKVINLEQHNGITKVVR